MLSVFRAQSVCELKQRDKSKIASLLLHGDHLLIGLNTGVLRIYRMYETINADKVVSGSISASTTESRVGELLREEDHFSKEPVQQLASVKEANLLVSLSGAFVSLHNLQTYELIERLDCTKGATCFVVTSDVAIDAETHVPSLVSKLAVATKHRVSCWIWQDTELVPGVTEIDLNARIRSLSWADSTRLVVGMDAGFSVVDLTSREIKPVRRPTVRTGSRTDRGEREGMTFGAARGGGLGRVAMSGWMPKPMATSLARDHVLLAKDVNSLFTDNSGHSLEKRQVPWTLAPEAIGYSYPYLLALQSSDNGAVQVWNPDTLSLLQTVSLPEAALLHVPQPNTSLAHAGRGFLVASDRTVWQMSALPYETQVAELVGKQRFDEAISLLRLVEDTLIGDKSGQIREVMTEKAIALFNERAYRPALDLFTEAEAAPDRVLALYGRSLVGSSTSRAEASEAWKTRANHATANIGARTRPVETRDTILEGEGLVFAVRCLFSFLAQARNRVQKHLGPDGVLKVNPPSFDRETGKPAFSDLLPQSGTGRTLEDVDWQAELLEVAWLVDTSLFRAYMLAEASLVSPLVRIDNFCDPSVVQLALCESGRYDVLVDFLYGKGLHRQALEMLSMFGREQADNEPPDGMRGPRRTVSYLKRLPPDFSDVVFEFVQWPLQEQPDVGMEVFLADSDNARGLPWGEVIALLRNFDVQLQIRYVEYTVHELGVRHAASNQLLVDLYVQKLKCNRTSDDERERLQAKLVSFLSEARGAYNENQTLEQLNTDNPMLIEARAVVLGAMGNHKEALRIYVYQIRDHVKARAYCYRNVPQRIAKLQAPALPVKGVARYEKNLKPLESDVANEADTFTALLGLYLSPPIGENDNRPQALELLRNHGMHLTLGSTLGLLPDDVALGSLWKYLRGRLSNTLSTSHCEMLICSLASVQRARTEFELSVGCDNKSNEKSSGRNRWVKIDEGDFCKVCHRRMGASAIRVYPDNTVLHHGCVPTSV